MTNIKPYTEINDAILSLDNGGRFYNLFTKAEDGIVSQAELGNVGGIFNDKQQIILFLEMTISSLNSKEKEIIISKLDKELGQTYLKYKPQILLPSEAKEKGKIASSAILKGVPRLIDNKSDFNALIMIPIMTGIGTSFMMIPIIDNYNVYELRDEKTSETFIIAHSRDSQELPHKMITIAGVLKEIKLKKDDKSNIEKFLEATYYITN